jgi:hypothetical protein
MKNAASTNRFLTMIGLAGLNCSKGVRIFNNGELLVAIFSNALEVTRRCGSGLSAKEFRQKYPAEVKLSVEAKKIVVEKLNLFPSESIVLLDSIVEKSKLMDPIETGEKLGGCFEEEEDEEDEPEELEDAVSDSSRKQLFERLVLKEEQKERESSINKAGDLYTAPRADADDSDEEGSESANLFDPDEVEPINAGGEGLVPISGDLGDRPKIIKIRELAGLPTEKSDQTLGSELLNRQDLRDEKRCTTHGVYLCAHCFPLKKHKHVCADTRSSGTPIWKLHDHVEKIEGRLFGYVPDPEPEQPPKNELEFIEREAKQIEKARLDKEELERRKKLGKKRVRAPKPKYTRNLRVENGFSTRQLATILDEPSFSAPFQVPDRTKLKDPLSIYFKWLKEIEADARLRGKPLNEGRRRGYSRYATHTKMHKVEYEFVDGKPAIVRADQDYEEPEITMVDGVLVTLDKPKTVAEKLPDGSTKIHIVKQVSMDKKTARRAGSRLPATMTPSTYGELIESLPLKWATIITKEEANFYREYAARNIPAEELQKKYPDLADDESRLQLENRIVRWGFIKLLLEPPLGIRSRDFEQELDESIALDIKMISKTGGACIGGGVYGSKLTKYGRSRNLTSFRTPPIQESWGSSYDVDNSGPDHDDYGEDSAA